MIEPLSLKTTTHDDPAGLTADVPSTRAMFQKINELVATVNAHDKQLVVSVPARSASTTRTIDPTNRFVVGVQGDAVRVMMPPKPTQLLTREQALTFAAWLVTLACDFTAPGELVEQLRPYLDAVLAT